jgi:MFS transporter, ACS family, glucarate transporter
MPLSMATQVSQQSEIGQRPTRVRFWVVVFAVTLAIITYIDRVCMSVAANDIQRDLGLSDQQKGAVFSAFVAAYALFEIPSGFLGDWMGARRVLMRIVIWWSCLTAFIGATWNFTSLMTTQVLFGVGESGAFPNITKAFTTWLPFEERVRAQGILWLSARWGGALTPSLVTALLAVMSWRKTFAVLGSVGLVWALFFYRWYRDNPRDNPNVNAAELALLRDNERLAAGHSKVPWAKFFRSRQVWLLCGQYFCLSYPWYFYITWLPTYLRNERHVDMGRSAVLGGLPLFLGGIGCLLGGFIARHITTWTGSTALTRRLLAFVGFTGACTLLVLAPQFENVLFTMIAMGFASFCNDLVMPGAWGACMDVGGKYAGTLSGTMNMMGNFGGALSSYMIGVILSQTHNWQILFYISAAVYFMGNFCWMALDPVTPLEKAEA